MIGECSLILLLGPGLLLIGGLLVLLSRVGLLLFGLPLGFLQLIGLGVPAEVRRIWDIYDERLGWVDADDAFTVDSAVASGDVSGAWLLGLMLLKGRQWMLSVWLVDLSL